MRCPACGGNKASAAKMERGFQVLCPCGYAKSVASLPQEVAAPKPPKVEAVAPQADIRPELPIEEEPSFILPEPLEVFDDTELTEEEE